LQSTSESIQDTFAEQQINRSQFATSQYNNSSLSEALNMLNEMNQGKLDSATPNNFSRNPDIAAGLEILDQIKKDQQSDKEPVPSNVVEREATAPSKSKDNGIGGM
jgi:hypothetical protein